MPEYPDAGPYAPRTIPAVLPLRRTPRRDDASATTAAAPVSQPVRPVTSWASPAGWPVYVVQDQGETLMDVARKSLGSAERWQEIQRLNPNVGPDALPLAPGTALRLPQ